MDITIADRLRPFSHKPGHKTLIPRTFWIAEIFPAALVISSVTSDDRKEFFLNIKGPVLPFTAEQDFEDGSLRIYGQSKDGYFRMKLKNVNSSLVLFFEKTPPVGIGLLDQEFFSGQSYEITKGTEPAEQAISKERIFLGSNKLKDWDLLRRRSDLREILPLWHALGLMTPSYEETGTSPVSDLLTLCERMVDLRERSEVHDLLFRLYRTGFSDGFVPRGTDEDFQGILPLGEKTRPPFSLLRRGSALIRSMLFREEMQEGKSIFHILPCLPSHFPAGKAISLSTKEGHLLDLEWTKHQIRRVCIRAGRSGEILCRFPSEIQSRRLKKRSKDKGRTIAKGESVSVEAGDIIYLDRFQK